MIDIDDHDLQFIRQMGHHFDDCLELMQDGPTHRLHGHGVLVLYVL